MASLDAGFAHAQGGTSPGYTADVSAGWCAQNWAGHAPTPFQRSEWLNALYGAAALDKTLSPLTATVRNREGKIAMRLPLLQRRRNGLQVIEFADLGMTDFNAPLLGPAAPKSPDDMKQAWRALRCALPNADFLSLQKMPRHFDGRPNPFTFLPQAHSSAANANPLTIGGDWDAFRYSWERTFRKELERSWRVFQRHPEAQFKVVQDPGEALHILKVMEVLQRERMQEVGARYMLDQPVETEFYRRLVQQNPSNGYAVLTALTAGDEIVAALLGVRHNDTYVMIRICHAGRAWSNCSPGRLIIERTMAHLYAQGCRVFDFSIGNYAYKRRFGVIRVPLMDVTAALGWRGLPALLRVRLAAVTRQYPGLHAAIRKLLGNPASREEAGL